MKLFLITHSLNCYEPYIYSSVTPLRSNEVVPHCILFSTPLHSHGHKFSDIYQIVSLPFQLGAKFIYLPTYFVNYLFSFINIVKIQENKFHCIFNESVPISVPHCLATSQYLTLNPTCAKVDILQMRLFLTTKDLKIMFTSKLKIIEIMVDLGLLTFS